MVNVHRVDDLMLDLYDVQYLYFVVTGLGIIKKNSRRSVMITAVAIVQQ